MIFKKMKKKLSKIFRVVMVLVFAIAVGIMLYPSFMDAVSGIRQTTVISGYAGDTAGLSDEEIAWMKNAAQNYNEMIYESQKERYFRYEGEEYEDEFYDSILVTGDSDYMAYVEIPKIDMYLPIAHGTESEELKYAAGHMHGTSLPVGGENTHCVIAAHTGLNNAQLFTDIDKLKVGDVVCIHVLDEIHAYAVCEINVVLPDDEDFYLQVEDGRDLLTLYTCTPYGINDHRLLVRCERTYPDPQSETAESGNAEIMTHRTEEILKAILIGLVPVLMIAAGSYAVLRRKGKNIFYKFYVNARNHKHRKAGSDG